MKPSACVLSQVLRHFERQSAYYGERLNVLLPEKAPHLAFAQKYRGCRRQLWPTISNVGLYHAVCIKLSIST
jgi:hypothetical protein